MSSSGSRLRAGIPQGTSSNSSSSTRLLQIFWEFQFQDAADYITRERTNLRSKMQVTARNLQILTASAILVLISGGIAAYAQDQSATANTSVAGAPIAQATTTTSTTTSTTSTTTTTTTSYTLCQSTSAGQVGKLVLPITTTGSSTGTISFSDSKGCLASIKSAGGVFDVQIALRLTKPLTQYNAVLVANGTAYALGSMVTGPSGAGQMDNQVLLATGTYVVSIQIFDASTNPGHSTLVLQTGQGTIVSSPLPTATDGQQPSHTAQGQQGTDKGGS